MKVNLNVNQSSANFGMAIKIQPSEDKKVASYLSRKLVTVKDAIELNKYYESQKIFRMIFIYQLQVFQEM